ncbi:MAG TPA: hypothetical protein DEW35_01180 [Ruminococcaceae bacterium]|nr:hypothetical protein [Oscillospiraceae bacterium]
MNRLARKIITVLLCFSLLGATFVFSTPVFSETYQQQIDRLEKEKKAKDAEIKELEKQKVDPQKQVDALNSAISAVQEQISVCNAEISKINGEMSANKKRIADKQAEMEADKLEFKKRVRAIYMSDFDSNIKILLGAESFSDFLQLTQLTASLSARDKAMIEKLTSEITEINKLNESNQKLLDSQVAIRATIKAKQAELEAKQAEITKVINQIDAEQSSLQKDKNALQKEINETRAKQRAYEDSLRRSSTNYQTFINHNTGFQWPVNGFRNISAGFQSNDSVHRGHHNGIDISGGGIQGQPIRAIADGVVELVSNSCSHNYKKYGNCCGNGYGNYCVINHGTIKGANYSAYYAHAQKIIVSPGQKVTQGQVIGYVGTTGWSTGYHLHLGILRNGSWINPMSCF